MDDLTRFLSIMGQVRHEVRVTVGMGGVWLVSQTDPPYTISLTRIIEAIVSQRVDEAMKRAPATPDDQG